MNRRAFTLIEMLTTVAALVIVLGLMVSLARYVRDRSARQLTEKIMIDLGNLVSEYERVHNDLPRVPPLMGDPQAFGDEVFLHRAAVENNRALVNALRGTNAHAMSAFMGLPSSIYDETSLRDAWGTPIVFMPPGAANIGMSPQNRRFFLSAGPDRRFATLEDNIYSYEAEMHK